MKNIYVGCFKDYLKIFYEKQKKLNAEIEQNNKIYGPEYAAKANSAVRAKQEQAYLEARQGIASTFEEVKGYLANCNFLNVENLTADRLLFSDNSGFDLTPEDIRYYVERYQNNPTMLRLIRDWITKHNEDDKFSGIKISLPSDQLNTYKQFADSALGMCDKIYTSTMSSIEVDCWADERFAGDLYAVIGNGMSLSDYKNSRVPESAKHCFDDVKLATQTGNGNTFTQ